VFKTDSSRPGAAVVSTWSLVGLRLALALIIVFTVRLGWLIHHAEKWNCPKMTPILFFGELPFLLALTLVSNSQNRKLVAGGSGIAFVSALAGLLLTPVLLFAAYASLWEAGNQYRYLIAIEKFSPLYFLGSVLLLVSAFRLVKADRKSFAIACSGATIYCFLALPLLNGMSIPGSAAIKVKKSNDVPSQVVENLPPRILALTACLVRRHALHPDTEYPSSLNAIGPDWHCEAGIADPVGFPRYWISYSPVKDPLNNKIGDFRIRAIPVGEDRFDPKRDFMSDRRGEILTFQQGPKAALQTLDADPHFFNAPYTEPRIRRLLTPQHTPSSDEVLDTYDRRWFACSNVQSPASDAFISSQGNACYAIRYDPPTADLPGSYAVSAQCVTYGGACMRSYFLDYDDVIHATSEPRPATAQDPSLLPCELQLICHDTIWTSSDEHPSGWGLLKDRTLYAIYTSEW
jgi:hypothetical protein